MAKFKSNVSFWSTGKNAVVPKYKNTTAIIFKNSGDVNVFLNGRYLLSPGEESPAISTAHPETVLDLDMEIVFEAGAAGNPFLQAIITQTNPIVKGRGEDNCEKF